MVDDGFSIQGGCRQQGAITTEPKRLAEPLRSERSSAFPFRRSLDGKLWSGQVNGLLDG